MAPKWPADKVERWSLDRLIPYATNARTHTPEQIDRIAASIQEWGWTVPILADEHGGVIAGHARILAARQLGLSDAPVMVATGWTQAQKRAYVLADNQLAINGAGWDESLLRVEMADLRDMAFDLSLIGFGEDEQAGLLADKAEGLTDPDDAPEPPEQPVSVLGDLWLLGRHRLLCGDSTVVTDVERVLGGVKPHLMVTDPPYGVEYDPNWRNERGSLNANGQRKMGAGGRAIGTVSNDDRSDWSDAWALFQGDVAYVWHGALHAITVLLSLASCGFEPRAQIIWAKNHIAVGRGHYHWQHEPCWYVVKKNGTGHWDGGRKQSTLWQIDKPQKSETGHGTQKPVECMRRPIENNSSPGQAVYEPFSGSGTTIVAAEMTGRSCHAIEISPAYIDVAVKRWQAFTGIEATLESDGRTFSELAANRVAVPREAGADDSPLSASDSYPTPLSETHGRRSSRMPRRGRRDSQDDADIAAR